MKPSRSFSQRARSPRLRTRQRGTILIIALIVLVAMTLAGIATMRSVDTATITAGNIGLRQASVNAADQGLQAGVAWLTAIPSKSCASLNQCNFVTRSSRNTASKTYPLPNSSAPTFKK